MNIIQRGIEYISSNATYEFPATNEAAASVRRGRNTSRNGAKRTTKRGGARIRDGADSEPEPEEFRRLSRNRASQPGEGTSIGSRKHRVDNEAHRGSGEHDDVSLDRKNESLAIDTSGNRDVMFHKKRSLEAVNIDLQTRNGRLEEKLASLEQKYREISAHAKRLEDINKRKAQELEELTKHAKDIDSLRERDTQKIKRQLEELEHLKKHKELANTEATHVRHIYSKRTVELQQEKAKVGSLQQQQANNRNHIEYLGQQNDELKRVISRANSDLERKNSILDKMEEKILALTSRGSMPEPRDDNYFSDKFDNLQTSLTQWAIRYFRTKYTITFEELPQELQDMLCKISRDPSGVFSNPKASKARAQIVCGALGNIFIDHANLSSPFLGVPTLSQKIRDFRSNLGGSARDVQRWYALASTLASQTPQFETQQSDGLKRITEDIQKYLQPLADTNLSSKDLYDGLLKIFTEFSHILFEVAQQDTTISMRTENYDGKQPGSPVAFSPEYMEDTEGYEEDSELVERGAIVNIAEFPGLFREVFDDNGNPTGQSVIISKIKVSCCKG